MAGFSTEYGTGIPSSNRWHWPNQGMIEMQRRVPISVMVARNRDLRKLLDRDLKAATSDELNALGVPVYRRSETPVTEYPLTGSIPGSALQLEPGDMMWREWVNDEDLATRADLIADSRRNPPLFSSFAGVVLTLPPGYTATWLV